MQFFIYSTISTSFSTSKFLFNKTEIHSNKPPTICECVYLNVYWKKIKKNSASLNYVKIATCWMLSVLWWKIQRDEEGRVFFMMRTVEWRIKLPFPHVILCLENICSLNGIFSFIFFFRFLTYIVCLRWVFNGTDLDCLFFLLFI